jgi:hypothetical protein
MAGDVDLGGYERCAVHFTRRFLRPSHQSVRVEACALYDFLDCVFERLAVVAVVNFPAVPFEGQPVLLLLVEDGAHHASESINALVDGHFQPSEHYGDQPVSASALISTTQLLEKRSFKMVLTLQCLSHISYRRTDMALDSQRGIRAASEGRAMRVRARLHRRWTEV